MLQILKKTFQSDILQNNFPGDKTERDLYLLLPEDWENSSKRFPVVYVLHAFGGNSRGFLNDNVFAPNLPERIERLLNENKIAPAIFVLPDCFTYYGGSQFLNSTATGNYEDYLLNEILPFVDANFPTIADKNSRAVVGKSSGGYGALRLAMKHADTFGLCASLSGDCYFEYGYLHDFPKAFRILSKTSVKDFMRRFWTEEKKGRDDFSALNIIGMSAAYSPNAKSENGFDLPFDLRTGEIRAEIWREWLANDPVRLAESYTENLKSLKLLYIDSGTRDEFFLDVGAKILCDKLKKLDVPHITEEFDDGHFNVSYRFNRAFELISKSFEN